jgi:hypothetical protein
MKACIWAAAAVATNMVMSGKVFFIRKNLYGLREE